MWKKGGSTAASHSMKPSAESKSSPIGDIAPNLQPVAPPAPGGGCVTEGVAAIDGTAGGRAPAGAAAAAARLRAWRAHAHAQWSITICCCQQLCY